MRKLITTFGIADMAKQALAKAEERDQGAADGAD